MERYRDKEIPYEFESFESKVFLELEFHFVGFIIRREVDYSKISNFIYVLIKLNK